MRLPCCTGRHIEAEAATAKNRGIEARDRQRELRDPIGYETDDER
jgi:hypothetical protein